MQTLHLDLSGRPAYSEHEVEILVVGGPSSNSQLKKTPDMVKNIEVQSLMLHLSNIKHAETPSSWFFFRSLVANIILYPPRPSDSSLCEEANTLVIEFVDDHFTKFMAELNTQLGRKSWLNYPLEHPSMLTKGLNIQSPSSSSTVSTPTQPLSLATAGISGVTRVVQEKHKAVDESMVDAFKDVDSLFEKAQEMVTLAYRFSSITNKDAKDAEFHTEMMRMMGIRSPVVMGTHDSYDLYCEELARELDGFLSANFQRLNQRLNASKNPALNTSSDPTATNAQGKLKISAEVIPITDLYCIFNRARGSGALISPEDLHEACKRLSFLRLRCKMIELSNKVLAVASETYNEDKIARQVATFLEFNPLSASQLASEQNITLPLSLHYLLRAEQLGLACRDESSEGLIFWPNIFFKYAPKQKSDS